MATSPTLADPARAKEHESVPVAQFSYAKNEANAATAALPRGKSTAQPSASDTPTMCMGSNGWITPKSLGLLSRASLALDEPVSWHPALRALEHGG